MDRNELLSLIDLDIDAAFEKLDEVFLHKNATYMALNKEYTDRPRDFSISSFTSQLKRFVSIHCSLEKKSKNKRYIVELDHYDLLCQIDFEPQFTHFKNARLKNRAAAVLLHGENDEKGNDLKWSYHQLLKLENLMDEPPICIDFRGNSNWSFGDVQNVLCEKFDLPSNFENSDIRRALEKYLKANDLVVLIKYVKQTSDFQDFCKSFYSFYSYLNKEIKEDNSLIFILLEDDLTDYNNLMNDYFLWFNEGEGYSHLKEIIKCDGAKIVDLAAVEMLNARTINGWINRNLHYGDVKDKFFDYIDNCDCFLDEGTNRYHVIKKLHSKLQPDNIEKFDQWLKY